MQAFQEPQRASSTRNQRVLRPWRRPAALTRLAVGGLLMVLVGTSPAGAATAVHDSTLRAATCRGSVNVCDSGALLERSAHMSPPESPQPNTLDGCLDGSGSAYYLEDESIERISVNSLTGGEIARGDRVRIDITFFPYRDGSDDVLDVFYTDEGENAGAVEKYHLARYVPSWAGLQIYSLFTTLPDTGNLFHRIRARLSSSNHAMRCNGRGFYDVDELAFSPAPPNMQGQGEYVLSSTDQEVVTWFGSDNVSEPTYSFSCPSGQTISKLSVHHNWNHWGDPEDYINSVRFACAELQEDGTSGNVHRWQGGLGYPEAFGPARGTLAELGCSPYLMAGVIGGTGLLVDELGMLCGDLADIQDGEIDPDLTQGPVGGDYGTPSQVQCPAGYVATGARISSEYSGEYLKGVELVCSKVVTTTERDQALRLGEIIGRICGNEALDCPFFNTFDQYLQLSTLHLQATTDWWEGLEFWHSPDAQVFDPKCINKDGSYSDCFDGEQAPNEATLLEEGWNQPVHGTDRHTILGMADDRVWTFSLPNVASDDTDPVNGISFRQNCLDGRIDESCDQQSFALSEITPLAPIVNVTGKGEHLVNSCHYTIDPDALGDTSLSIDTIVQDKDEYLKLTCHSSAEQLNTLALSGTTAENLLSILRAQTDLDYLNMLSGQIFFAGLNLAREGAEVGSTLQKLLTGIQTGLRVKFGLDNLKGFVSGLEAFAACDGAICRSQATLQIMVSGFFLKQDLGDLYKFGDKGKLSSILNDLNITNSELGEFLDEELEPLLDTVEKERWSHFDCND